MRWYYRTLYSVFFKTALRLGVLVFAEADMAHAWALSCVLFSLLAAGLGCHKAPDVSQPYTPKPSNSGEGLSSVGGFNLDEAREMIEFCIDLNNQDDLDKHPNLGSVYKSNISDARWGIVADSRLLSHPGNPDPKSNGFPPFDSAWTLYQQAGRPVGAPPLFVLAIRGTVAVSFASLTEDALATTIPGKNGIEFPVGQHLPVVFSELPEAEVHVGFAYAALGLLFDYRYGVLRSLDENVPAGSILMITGHSQGAALATLVHAFLHYAMENGQFGLKDRNYALKSYGFAQPKPGNQRFSLDFASYTSTQGTAFILNNTLDSIPQVPLTHQTLTEAVHDLPLFPERQQILIRSANLFSGLRGLVSNHVEGQVTKLTNHEEPMFYRGEELRTPPVGSVSKGISLDYASAGTLIPLWGRTKTTYYPGVPMDPFIQHHATTYRALLPALAPGAGTGAPQP
jgi:hypothetical protein